MPQAYVLYKHFRQEQNTPLRLLQSHSFLIEMQEECNVQHAFIGDRHAFSDYYWIARVCALMSRDVL